MDVKDVMTAGVITVGPRTPIHEAARLMVNHGVSGLPVIDPTGRLVGIISEGDLIVRQKPREHPGWWRTFFDDGERLAREYRKAAGSTVGEVMTAAVISVGPDASLATAALLLHKHNIRRLPVLSNGTLVGIVSRGDLVKALTGIPTSDAPRTDEQLAADMRARMAREPWAERHAVIVEANGGVLGLWGTVDSDDERAALETMARTVPGCREVDNQLVVRALPYQYAP